MLTALFRALKGLFLKAPDKPLIPAIPLRPGDEDRELLLRLHARRHLLQDELVKTDLEIRAACLRLYAKGNPQFAEAARTEIEAPPPPN